MKLNISSMDRVGCYLKDIEGEVLCYLTADEARQLHEDLRRYCHGTCHEVVRRREPVKPVAPPEEEVE